MNIEQHIWHLHFWSNPPPEKNKKKLGIEIEAAFCPEMLVQMYFPKRF